MTRSLTLILLTMIIAATAAPALEQEAGVRLLLTDPVGAFDEAVNEVGGGLSIHYGVRPSRQFTLGVGMHAMMYGSESREYDLPLVDEFELTTTNNMAGGFLFAQFRPIQAGIEPYGEVRLGTNYFWTESELEDDDWWGDGGVATETNDDDWAGFWSVGGGLLITLHDGDSKPGVLLDLKVTYQQGGTAEYLGEGDVDIVDDEPVYEVSESETDLMMYELGVVLTF